MSCFISTDSQSFSHSASLGLGSLKEILSIHWTCDLSLSLAQSQSQSGIRLHSLKSKLKTLLFSSALIPVVFPSWWQSPSPLPPSGITPWSWWLDMLRLSETGPLSNSVWYLIYYTLLIWEYTKYPHARRQFNNEPNQAVYQTDVVWLKLVTHPFPRATGECKQWSKSRCVIKK